MTYSEKTIAHLCSLASPSKTKGLQRWATSCDKVSLPIQRSASQNKGTGSWFPAIFSRDHSCNIATPAWSERSRKRKKNSSTLEIEARTKFRNFILNKLPLITATSLVLIGYLLLFADIELKGKFPKLRFVQIFANLLQ